MSKTALAVLALAGSAAAFNAPMMSGAATRRDAMAGAAGAAVVAPLLRPASAEAAQGVRNIAPVITVFDHRPCNRPTKEYKGEKTSDQDDRMCVMLKMQQVAVTDGTASRILAETIGLLPKYSNINDYYA
uniref:Phycoerythrin alpha chain domain-containing protein n=1 Tax=Hemiselmis andersenii TaxID=464988 RepID=A0A6U4SRB4_HEMAN|mmetsp:Transcript_15186/g.36802  ORF Transcript_15186/g.36802 Transcript_15186/m.36802 type:complete len:130 (+) Transcript_15186:42-431(+)